MKTFAFIALLTLTISTALSQSISREDYARAVSFLWDNVNNKKAFNLTVTPNWYPDSTGFWFVTYGPSEKKYEQAILKPLKRSPLFDHVQLAAKLGGLINEPVDAKSLPLENIGYIKRDQLEFSVKGKRYLWDASTGLLKQKTDKETEQNTFESKSPDGKWIAFVKDYNLFIKPSGGGQEKQLSNKGLKDYEYGSYYGWSDIIEGENGERPRRFAVQWSPDSRYIQTNICDLRNARKMYLLDWSIDSLYRAKLLGYYRGSPGDTAVVHLVPVVFDTQTGKETRLPIPRVPHELGYSFRWLKEPGWALLQDTERGYHKTSLLKVNVNTGETKTLFTESSNTNIDGFSYRISDKLDKLVVTSEKTGWKQLYTVDLSTGAVKALTTGEFFVNDAGIDYHDNTIYFVASGKEPGRNPYQQYLYRIGYDGKNLKLLTPEEGNHDINDSPDGKYLVDNYSTPQAPTRAVLRETKTGKVLMELSAADISGLKAMNWSAPQNFTAIGKDNKSTIYGLLWRPSNFDPAKKYPIIDNSYTGPHGQIVPRTFSRAVGINNQALAELGFIVMMVDGLGTANRSKEFHNYSYKKMGFNLEDHVRAIRQLAKQNSWIDTTRVGIFGHSAGGYDAGHAMMQYPDFYKVAVASSADHDFRMEKAWWPEMYMGWPVDSAYQNQSTITMASRLKGKLLITHGGIDENVNPSATFKLAEMLERADKPFDMLIFPSQRHGYTGTHQLYFTKRRWNYFVEHLLGATPIWDFPWK